MQNAVLAMIIGVSFLGLTLVAMASRRGGRGPLGLQLALGTLIGFLAAAVVLSVRTDLVPDEIEVVLGVALVAILAGGLITLRWFLQRPH